MIEVIKKGLETSVQDYPGRIGSLNQGFPASGPMDSWSFRLANILVGNKVGEAALECQFMGPTLKFKNILCPFSSIQSSFGPLTTSIDHFLLVDITGIEFFLIFL